MRERCLATASENNIQALATKPFGALQGYPWVFHVLSDQGGNSSARWPEYGEGGKVTPCHAVHSRT